MPSGAKRIITTMVPTSDCTDFGEGTPRPQPSVSTAAVARAGRSRKMTSGSPLAHLRHERDATGCANDNFFGQLAALASIIVGVLLNLC